MNNPVTGFADVSGAKIYYEVGGEGHPLILLHAGIGDSRMWDDQFAVFAEHYRTVRYDARGFGRTEMVAGPYSAHEDLFGLMRFLGIERAYLLGCSMGGQAIIDFALAHADMAAALIPVGAAVSGFQGRGGSPEDRAEMEAAYGRGDLDTCAEIMLRVWIDGPKRSPDQVSPAIRDRVREMMLIFLRTPDDLGQELEAEPPALDRLGAIRAPTLVIYGDGDQPNIIEIAGLLAEKIPGARKALMAGTAHAPNMERPDEFNRLVLDFLAHL